MSVGRVFRCTVFYGTGERGGEKMEGVERRYNTALTGAKAVRR